MATSCTRCAGRLQVLYTDYNVALMYACAVESPPGGKCPRDQSRVVVYGRHKWIGARLPDNVRESLETVANDACVYLEDFQPATLPTGTRIALVLEFLAGGFTLKSFLNTQCSLNRLL